MVIVVEAGKGGQVEEVAVDGQSGVAGWLVSGQSKIIQINRLKQTRRSRTFSTESGTETERNTVFVTEKTKNVLIAAVLFSLIDVKSKMVGSPDGKL